MKYLHVQRRRLTIWNFCISVTSILLSLKTYLHLISFQAGLVIRVMVIFTSVCGASLISATRLVTAAHCQFDGSLTANSMTVVLGTNTIFSGGSRIAATSVVMHPDWNPSTAANDIAIISITAVTFSGKYSKLSITTLTVQATSINL